MTDAMVMISRFINHDCSTDAGFDPKNYRRVRNKDLFNAQNLFKSRLGRNGPLPLAEALEVVSSLPSSERLECSLGIIQSMRHLFCHDDEEAREEEGDSRSC